MTSRIILIIMLFAVFGCFEWRFAAERGQRFSGRARNALHAAVFLLFGGVSAALLYGLLPGPIWQRPDRGVPFSILLVLASLFAGDCIFYWYHRLEHAWKPLWRVHALHHADRELNATTSLRLHWLEGPLQAAAISIPVAAIVGHDARAAAMVPIALTVWLTFTHANLRLRLGPLTGILGGPQMHRIHHSIEPRHRDRNFANFFPIFDRLFGTYYAPAHDEFPATGDPRPPRRIS